MQSQYLKRPVLFQGGVSNRVLDTIGSDCDVLQWGLEGAPPGGEALRNPFKVSHNPLSQLEPVLVRLALMRGGWPS